MTEGACQACGDWLRRDGGCLSCETGIDYDAKTINGYPVERWFNSSTYTVIQFKVNGVTVAFVDFYQRAEGEPYPAPYFAVPYGVGVPDDLRGAVGFEEDDEDMGFYWLQFDNFALAKAWAESDPPFRG